MLLPRRVALSSHPLGSLQPEQIETGRHDSQDKGAEGQPRIAHLVGVGLEHRAVLVEGGEALGELEQVGTEPVRLVRGSDLDHDVTEAEQEQGEGALLRLRDDDLRPLL